MTTMITLSEPTMSNPNSRVAVMVARVRGKSSSHHGDPADNASTNAGMITRARGDKSSQHGDPVDSAITNDAVKTKTVCVRKNE